MSKRKTQEEWIAEAKKVHGEMYSYEKAVYAGGNAKIEIICPEHGSFWQNCSSHLSGTKCPQCVKDENSKKFNGTKNGEFFKKAIAKYGDKYDLSKVKQERYGNKIEIICREHNLSFWKRPEKFLSGSGCPKCARSYSAGEQAIAKFLSDHNISFTKEKVFKDLPHKRFDFFLKTQNTCIEFHGIQHYEYKKFFHRKDWSFEHLKESDVLKKNFCQENGINYNKSRERSHPLGWG